MIDDGGDTVSMAGDVEERPAPPRSLPDASTEDIVQPFTDDGAITPSDVEQYLLGYFPYPNEEERAACRAVARGDG